MRSHLIGSLGIACAVIASQALVDAQGDHRLAPTIAILEFDARPAGTTLPPPHLGTTLADLLLDRLVASKAYRVVDARWLPAPVRDGPGGRENLGTLRQQLQSAQIDYVAIGSMTRFSTEDRNRAYGGGIIIPLLGAVRRNKVELAVGITVRVIDVRSGEIATTATGQSMSARRNLALGGAAFVAHGGGGGFSQSSANSRDAMLAEAIRGAVMTAADGIVNAAPRLMRDAGR